MRVDVRASVGCASGRAWRCVCACACARALAHVGAGVAAPRPRGPRPRVATSVIAVHTTNVCDPVNSLLSLERYSCVVNLGFVFVSFHVFFFLFVWFFGLFLLSLPLQLLFMKLENLKDCCVFVNNKTIVHSVLVNVPRPNCYFWSPSPRGCGLFLMFPLPPHSQCERVGPDPVLGARPSYFNHKTPSSSG